MRIAIVLISLKRKVSSNVSFIELLTSFLGTPLSVTDSLRVVAAVATFSYASYTDIKERRVRNKVWIPVAVVSLALLGYDLFTGSVSVLAPKMIINIGFLSALAFVIYKLQIFYGADFKALVVISVLFPLQPVLGQFPLYSTPTVVTFNDVMSASTLPEALGAFNLFLTTSVFGFTLISNIALCSVFYLVWNAAYNIRNGRFRLRSPLRSFTARKVDTGRLQSIHGQVIQPTTESNPVLRGVEFLKHGLRGLQTDFFEDYLNWHTNTAEKTPSDISNLNRIRLESFLEWSEKWEASDTEKDKAELERIIDNNHVWVTPGVPFLVPITLGLLLSLVGGNAVYAITALLL